MHSIIKLKLKTIFINTLSNKIKTFLLKKNFKSFYVQI